MTASATVARTGARAKAARRRARARFRSSGELREVLERLLRSVDADERVGPLLRAAALRIRFEFPDRNTVLNVRASEEGGSHLSWSFGDVDWEPRLTLTMESEVANGYLQGRESLPIAIARGKVRPRGESRVALLYLPALRLICEPYRRLIGNSYPHLALD
jgi:hypothetical protein